MDVRSTSRLILLSLVLAGLLLAGCGGSGSSSSVVPETTTSVTGTVTAGAVDGGSLSVLDLTGNVVAGPVQTSQGSYSVDIPDDRLGEDLVMECTGGTFIDEATGEPTSAGTMSAYLAMNTLTLGSEIHLTPGSTVVRGMIRAGLSQTEAEAAFAGAFGFTPDLAIEPNLQGDGTDEQNLAGLRTGAFSRLTADLGYAPADQFDLLAAISEDLADGDLDGEGATIMELTGDTANHFAGCLIEQGKGMGMAADQLGSLPFATVAETESYQIEYLAGMMGAMQGKTVFSLKVTDLVTAAPVTGATLNLKATMTMATMSHGTPVDSVTEMGDGVYQCTVYYLMASMMNGVSAGYWSLQATVNDEAATFYPNVTMAMGDTTRATLKDANDKIAGMMGQPASVRSYYLFKNSLSGETGNHILKLFLATRESLMNHPALFTGQVLTDENGQSWTVTTMNVQLSTDGGNNWTEMVDDGNGSWVGAAISDLVEGESATILVRLLVNGVEKTGNGEAGGDPASFTMTP
ncbi:MAG: FixH family protein [Proteobacteria bacterium]|nr:FixH family protein [Pseudomonadota bacterium]MBU1714892.1 FixH family protein [Pseudomonadota bacterium]